MHYIYIKKVVSIFKVTKMLGKDEWSRKFLALHDQDGSFAKLFKSVNCFTLPEEQAEPRKFADGMLELVNHIIGIRMETEDRGLLNDQFIITLYLFITNNTKVHLITALSLI